MVRKYQTSNSRVVRVVARGVRSIPKTSLAPPPAASHAEHSAVPDEERTATGVVEGRLRWEQLPSTKNEASGSGLVF